MFTDRAFKIGYIKKTHGVTGQLSVVSTVRLAEAETWPEWVFIKIDSGLVPFRTREEDMIWRDEKNIILALDDYKDQDKAKKIVGHEVWFPNEFSDMLEGSAEKLHPLIGYLLVDSVKGELGEIDDYIDLPNNPLFQLTYQGNELLIPAREEWITAIDEKSGKIEMELPDGLLDM